MQSCQEIANLALSNGIVITESHMGFRVSAQLLFQQLMENQAYCTYNALSCYRHWVRGDDHLHLIISWMERGEKSEEKMLTLKCMGELQWPMIEFRYK